MMKHRSININFYISLLVITIEVYLFNIILKNIEYVSTPIFLSLACLFTIVFKPVTSTLIEKGTSILRSIINDSRIKIVVLLIQFIASCLFYYNISNNSTGVLIKNNVSVFILWTFIIINMFLSIMYLYGYFMEMRNVN